MVVYESVPFNLIETVSSCFNPYTSAVNLCILGIVYITVITMMIFCYFMTFKSVCTLHPKFAQVT